MLADIKERLNEEVSNPAESESGISSADIVSENIIDSETSSQKDASVILYH